MLTAPPCPAVRCLVADDVAGVDADMNDGDYLTALRRLRLGGGGSGRGCATHSDDSNAGAKPSAA
jgi:hypothetical protein